MRAPERKESPRRSLSDDQLRERLEDLRTRFGARNSDSDKKPQAPPSRTGEIDRRAGLRGATGSGAKDASGARITPMDRRLPVGSVDRFGPASRPRPSDRPGPHRGSSSPGHGGHGGGQWKWKGKSWGHSACFYPACFNGFSLAWWSCDWSWSWVFDRYRYRRYCAPYWDYYRYDCDPFAYRPYSTPTYVTYYTSGYNDSAWEAQPCPWSIAEAWDLLAGAQDTEAREAFECLARELPEDGLPGIGLSLAALRLARDDEGIAALREAVRADPDALRFVPVDERLRALIAAQATRLEARAKDRFADLDALFGAAALRFMLGDLAAAHYAVKVARTLGDDDASAIILELVIEMEVGEPPEAAGPSPDLSITVSATTP